MTEPLPTWETDVRRLSEFARIRLVAVDLDGTLLRSAELELSETVSGLRRALQHPRVGVSLTLATGRTLTGLRPILGELGLPKGTPLILYNGSIVVSHGDFQVLHRRIIPVGSLSAVVEASSRYRVRTLAYVVASEDDQWFRPEGARERVVGWSMIDRPDREFNRMVVDWQDRPEVHVRIPPAAILVDTSQDPDATGRLLGEFARIPGISCTRSGNTYIEVRPKGANKGAALQHVAHGLGLQREQLLALGDNDNDCEMLQWAGIGVAISGASPAALSSSDFVCNHGAVEGAIEVLRLVKEARRYFRSSGVPT